MTSDALIVWNNGDSYDNTTYLVLVEPRLLDDIIKLMELDSVGGGVVMAIATEVRQYSEHFVKTLDEWLRDRAFSLCMLSREMGRDDTFDELLKMPVELRSRLAEALLHGECGFYHESWIPKVKAFAAELLRGAA